jgi:hypothetical protein
MESTVLSDGVPFRQERPSEEGIPEEQKPSSVNRWVHTAQRPFDVSQLTRVYRLRRRLIFMGILNAIFAPFIVVYLLMYSFFRYFEVRVSPVVVGRF